MKKLIGLICVLCVLCVLLASVMPVYAESFGKPMLVVNCEEWVSLRSQPTTQADRLTKVPLGAMVENCVKMENGFTYCAYQGRYGFILTKYLTDQMQAYQSDTDDSYADPFVSFHVSNGQKVQKNGVTLLNQNGYVVKALRSFPEDGEMMEVSCYLNGKEQWGYTVFVTPATELSLTEAFWGGTVQDPRIMVYSAQYGLTMLDLVTGRQMWNLPRQKVNLGGSLATAVDENGTMYIAGYLGPDPVAIAMNGSILWKSDVNNDDIYWPYKIIIYKDYILTHYDTGSEGAHNVVAYSRANGQKLWENVYKDASD